MNIILARIDNRLIHGQIVQGWLQAVRADKILVVSEEAAQSALMKKMFALALPDGYKLKVANATEAADYLKQDGKVFVIIEDFQALAAMAKAGVVFSTVNVGNTKYEAGKKEVRPGIFLSAEETTIVKDLIAKNVKFDVRALPQSLSVRLF